MQVNAMQNERHLTKNFPTTLLLPTDKTCSITTTAKHHDEAISHPLIRRHSRYLYVARMLENCSGEIFNMSRFSNIRSGQMLEY